MDNLILFDFSNLAHRCIHLKQIEAASENPEYALWHYMVFQAMYDYVIQTAADFGGTFDVVLALESHSGYWRKNIYHPYKGDRLVKKAIYGMDWARIYEEFDVLTRNIRECLPWKVISAPKCEADDVIYTLTQQHLLEHPEGKVFVHSGDSDYLQLVQARVFLYNPAKQEYATFPYDTRVNGKDFRYESRDEFLQYSILTGQGGKDNVYNIETPTDWSGSRKPGFGIAAAAKALAHPEGLDAWLATNGMADRYERNRVLIDMRALPEEYYSEIVQAYQTYPETKIDVQGFIERYRWPSLASAEARADIDAVLSAVAGIDVQQPAVVKAEEGSMDFVL